MCWLFWLKFTFSEKATKIDKIFTDNLTVCSNCRINGEDFVNFVAFLENMNFFKSWFKSWVYHFHFSSFLGEKTYWNLQES